MDKFEINIGIFGSANVGKTTLFHSIYIENQSNENTKFSHLLHIVFSTKLTLILIFK